MHPMIDTSSPSGDARESSDLLLREFHHRVRNNLQVVCSFLNLQIHRHRSPCVHVVARQTQVRLHAIALVHDQLSYKSGHTLLRLDSYVSELLTVIAGVYGLVERGITVKLQCPSMLVSGDDALRVGLIVNELSSNAARHAFKDRKPGGIRITIKRSRIRRLVITVSDDGVGLPSSFAFSPDGRSIGLTVVSNIVQHRQGQLTWRRLPAGVRFIATLRLATTNDRRT